MKTPQSKYAFQIYHLEKNTEKNMENAFVTISYQTPPTASSFILHFATFKAFQVGTFCA